MSDVPAIITWMQTSNIGTGIRESFWTFPIIETTHVLALAVSVGLLVWFDLRLLGVGMKHQPISQIHKQIMPYAVIGFVIMFVSGALLFWSEAEKCYRSGFFRAKIAFLVIAAFNATIFELRTKKTIAEWDKHPIPPMKARIAGWLSLLSWTAVIIAGRATAYNLF
jgi:predicted histidine transporter YuiF (NhaC family)